MPKAISVYTGRMSEGTFSDIIAHTCMFLCGNKNINNFLLKEVPLSRAMIRLRIYIVHCGQETVSNNSAKSNMNGHLLLP